MRQVRIIGGKWRRRWLSIPRAGEVRPTPDRVRETLFNWLSEKIEGARCLDLFAGTGVLGFEALSRGATQVTFVDKHPRVIRALYEVAQELQTSECCEIILSDAVAWLHQKKAQEVPYSVIFLDPPFQSELLKQSLAVLRHSPLVTGATWLYLEAPRFLQEAELPPDWELLKQKQAGEVAYHLVRGACS